MKNDKLYHQRAGMQEFACYKPVLNNWELLYNFHGTKWSEKMQDNQREELIYLAGLFDGEGTITINSGYSKKYVIKNRCSDMGYGVLVRIGMNDEKSIRRYHEFFGVGQYFSEKEYKGYRAMHRWQSRKQDQVKKVILKLEPFLKLKKPQAQLALKFLEECTRPKDVRIGVAFPPELIKKRYEFYIQMKILNGIDVSDYSPATTKRIGRPKSIRAQAIV
ncbi:MAG TPA: hypothetical protein VFX43_09380 [Chitinophagaceae bacterium]|nr:hypothetical protein [Chitinophagaceae bacterium]